MKTRGREEEGNSEVEKKEESRRKGRTRTEEEGEGRVGGGGEERLENKIICIESINIISVSSRKLFKMTNTNKKG